MGPRDMLQCTPCQVLQRGVRRPSGKPQPVGRSAIRLDRVPDLGLAFVPTLAKLVLEPLGPSCSTPTSTKAPPLSALIAQCTMPRHGTLHPTWRLFVDVPTPISALAAALDRSGSYPFSPCSQFTSSVEDSIAASRRSLHRRRVSTRRCTCGCRCSRSRAACIAGRGAVSPCT